MNILNFLKKYGVLLVILIAGIAVGVWFYLKKKPSSVDPVKANADAERELNRIGQVSETHNTYLKDRAQNLAHHLGTAYHGEWWNPRGWTENDKVAFEIVNELNRTDFNSVAKIYPFYADGNDLRNDLLKLLDSDYYEQIRDKIL